MIPLWLDRPNLIWGWELENKVTPSTDLRWDFRRKVAILMDIIMWCLWIMGFLWIYIMFFFLYPIYIYIPYIYIHVLVPHFLEYCNSYWIFRCHLWEPESFQTMTTVFFYATGRADARAGLQWKPVGGQEDGIPWAQTATDARHSAEARQDQMLHQFTVTWWGELGCPAPRPGNQGLSEMCNLCAGTRIDACASWLNRKTLFFFLLRSGVPGGPSLMTLHGAPLAWGVIVYTGSDTRSSETHHMGLSENVGLIFPMIYSHFKTG